MSPFVTWEGVRPPVSVVLVEKAEGKARSLYPLEPEFEEFVAFGQLVADGLVRGDQGGVTAIRMSQGKFLLCVDVGSREKLVAEPDLLRQAGGRACAYLRTHPGLPAECALIMPQGMDMRPVSRDVRLVLEGFGLRDDCVSRTDEGQKAEREIPLPQVLAFPTPEMEADEERAVRLASLGRWVRETGNLRGEECTPFFLAERAMAFLTSELGEEVQFPYGRPLDLDFYQGKVGLCGAEGRRWGAFLAVNESMLMAPAGLNTRPHGVLATYRCGIPGAKTLAILGKMICYDSGAWALKTPVIHMATMHLDKHGFVTAVALFIELVKQGVPFDMVLMGNGTYNFPGFLAGSFLTTRGGRKIQNWNPDAEGRLTLDDGLDFLIEGFNPDIVMPIATLTGAASVALGPMANLFSSDPSDPLMLSVFTALRRSGILGWPMPVGGHLSKGMSCPEGDMKNVDTSGAKQGGSTTAAYFLERAVAKAITNYGKDRPHQPVMHHWDIAPIYESTPDGWRLDGASVDPLLATIWAMENQGFPGGVLVPRSV